MKLKKYLAKGLTLGIIIINVPLYSFAINIEDKYEINNIEIKEDFQKSTQRAVKLGDVDTWITELTDMPTSRSSLTSQIINNKIYCIGGYSSTGYTRKVEIYDIETNSWSTGTNMPTGRSGLESVVIGDNIYCIGGRVSAYSSYSDYSNKLEIYNTKTDTWSTGASMPTPRENFSAVYINNKIYCMGGYYKGAVNDVQIYDINTDTWSTGASMPTARESFMSHILDDKIYCFGGQTSSSGSYLKTVESYNINTNTWIKESDLSQGRSSSKTINIDNEVYIIGGKTGPFTYIQSIDIYDTETGVIVNDSSLLSDRRYFTANYMNGKIYCIGGEENSNLSGKIEVYIAKEPSVEEQSTSSVSNAELTKDLVDIETARNLVNQLPEGELKIQLQARLDAIVPNISLTPLNGTSSIDAYIKTENILSMTVDTNTITFDDFSGIEDMNKPNAINITVSSSLPYQLNAYLPVEIQNADKSNTMDKSILNIKENGEVEYKTFTTLNEKLVLKDNCIAGDDIVHRVDFKLKGGIAHKKDVYKATIKLEVEQK